MPEAGRQNLVRGGSPLRSHRRKFRKAGRALISHCREEQQLRDRTFQRDNQEQVYGGLPCRHGNRDASLCSHRSAQPREIREGGFGRLQPLSENITEFVHSF
ncbi:Hypothetical predicted protein [Podarcis lilfordi]|uniref:Uncharacterized protein n=1 Tax=Podarcis lilfordi TaxID=74358 RepID=A0AA35NTU9_9SAUR|nr:Hypothetical predicted protein [Podarcis lilfordi]